MQKLRSKDDLLRRKLEAFSIIDKDYWSFRGKAARDHVHAYFQYPAMMVPQMQGELIQTLTEIDPEIKTVFDPFVGSGTVMSESMAHGLNFSGQDINPLAVLLCKSKIGPFYLDAIKEKIPRLLEEIRADRIRNLEVDFPGLSKWFKEEVAVELSQIKRAIQNENSLWARRFFWIALAETVRLTSNSRTSTFKLHIRREEDIQNRNLSPASIFNDVITRNLERFGKQKKLLDGKGYLRKGHYKGDVKIKYADSASRSNGQLKQYDLLLTSPPYGDNKTTVPYGQHSYLPLQWIDLEDIGENVSSTCLSSTAAIDSLSLGGSLQNALNKRRLLEAVSPSFKKTMEELEKEPKDRKIRIASFCLDLNNSLEAVLPQMRPNAYMIWVIGNRRVAQRTIPSDTILSELLESKGASYISTLQRKIPTKRMAIKNNFAATMATESILVFKKGQ